MSPGRLLGAFVKERSGFPHPVDAVFRSAKMKIWANAA
jgi:hypothetical protein